jgi:cytokinesis protein
VQLLDLKRDLAELKSGSVQHKKELDRFLDEAEERLEDPYTKLMLPFLNEAHQDLQRLSDQVTFTERQYVEALRYFGEGPDPKRRGFPAVQPMRTEDFFGVFREFCTAYRKVKSDNVRIGEQRAIEAKRRAAAEERERERQEALARKEAGVDDSAVLETLLGNLRSGGVVPKQKRKARERGEARRSAAKAVDGSPGAAPSIDGNPSDVAAAMLARLQGSAGGATTPSASSRPVRRRDRRTGEPRDRDSGRTSTLSAAPLSAASLDADAEEPATPTEHDAVQERDEAQNAAHEEEHDDELPTPQANGHDVDDGSPSTPRTPSTPGDDGADAPLSAAQRASALMMTPERTRQQAALDEAALEADLSAGSGLQDWVDPHDLSGFSAASQD